MSNEKIEYLNLELLHPFENNPFQSVDEIEYDELRDSVKDFRIPKRTGRFSRMFTSR